ncbi:cation diffusion facilitator family transporter [Ammoniphilus sp. YIM 78166]|uniref:cation diffusion facilitator family transporter n=1 Tax=Ammoniphilus sp. YIM 78166 TaxID=1644106 RepID=UPI003519A959
MVEHGAWLSIGAYVFLSLVKLIIGYSTNSEALIADGLNNSTDIILSIAILIGIKISKRPADANHMYGHSKAESIASLLASFIMVSVGLNIMWNSFQHIFNSTGTAAPDTIAAWIAVFCAGVMYAVYSFNRKLAMDTNSQAIHAAAKDNLSDVWVSIGAAIGILGAQFNMSWLDPLAALVVGFMICRTAWTIFRESSHVLTDGFDEAELPQYIETIMLINGVRAVDDVKARSNGSEIFVDVVIHVDPNMDIVKCHDICNNIEKIMLERHHVSNVHIHIEPDTDKKLVLTS